MPKKKKRAPSKYNLHVKKEMKKGRTMAEAARSWNKKKSSKKPTKKRASKPRKKSTRKQTTRRRKPRAQKVLFPTVNRILRNGPIRATIRRVLGR